MNINDIEAGYVYRSKDEWAGRGPYFIATKHRYVLSVEPTRVEFVNLDGPSKNKVKWTQLSTFAYGWASFKEAHITQDILVRIRVFDVQYVLKNKYEKFCEQSKFVVEEKVEPSKITNNTSNLTIVDNTSTLATSDLMMGNIVRSLCDGKIYIVIDDNHGSDIDLVCLATGEAFSFNEIMGGCNTRFVKLNATLTIS